MSARDMFWTAEAIGWVLLVVFLVALAGWVSDKRTHRGVSRLRRRAIRREGIRATATVIDVQYRTIDDANDMVLEVQREGAAAYRVEVAEVISVEQNNFALSGMRIAVFVDRDDPKQVVLDLDDLDRRVRQKDTDAKEEHARLLRGG